MLSVTPCVPAELRVVLLLGGTSGEREISLATGAASLAALREEGFEVVEIDPADADYHTQLADAHPDVAFICLHGKGGEDGVIQAELEGLGIPYTGSGVQASATAMDKTRTKEVYRAAQIPTPVAVVIERDETWRVEDIATALGGRCVVKPATEGSALGVHIVHEAAHLSDALADALSIDTQALVERQVEGVEVTVAVLGNETPVALPVIEIVPINEFYDFESKYAPGGSTHIIPARISDAATAACKDFAIRAHQALGCRGMSRTDFIIDADDVPWTLETNTIPGMTPTSLLPDAARAAGIEFGPLCRLLVELALEDVPTDER